MLDDGLSNPVFSEDFYKQPLIKYLGSGSMFGLIKKPSYLSATNFSKTVMALLKGSYSAQGEFEPLAAEFTGRSISELIKASLSNKDHKYAKSETFKYISSLYEESNGDLEKFRTALEQWYDDTMDRVTSWYKKWTQVISIVVGFVLAFTFNVDTILIIQNLSKSPEARARYIEMAKKMDDNYNSSNGSTTDRAIPIDSLKKNYDSLKAEAIQAGDVLSISRKTPLGWNPSSWFPEGPMSLTGWLITALALSFGAPFWFDLLNKLMKLRSSVQIKTSNDTDSGNARPNTNKTKSEPVA
jgi:hypothetical protein